MGKFAAFIEYLKNKSASASGGLCLLIPWPGALPLDPAGGSATDPRYRLALSRSPWGRAPTHGGLEREPPLSLRAPDCINWRCQCTKVGARPGEVGWSA